MLSIFSDFNSFIYNLNPEQRLRFIDFLNTLKLDGLKIAFKSSGNRNRDISIDELIEDIHWRTECEEIRAAKTLAASKGETTIPNDDWGVHETHCCLEHGCKYGDKDCPVALDLIKQRYFCESCHDEKLWTEGF